MYSYYCRRFDCDTERTESYSERERERELPCCNETAQIHAHPLAYRHRLFVSTYNFLAVSHVDMVGNLNIEPNVNVTW